MAITNEHKVPAKMWSGWNDRARFVFNETFGEMTREQWAFLHPGQAEIPRGHWETTAWNAAIVAAFAVMNPKLEPAEYEYVEQA